MGAVLGKDTLEGSVGQESDAFAAADMDALATKLLFCKPG